MTWIFLGGENSWVHAHTGVMSHLIGPAAGRMVARWLLAAHPKPASACERMRGAAASASVERDGKEGCRVPNL